jgi:hypothetical protein
LTDSRAIPNFCDDPSAKLSNSDRKGGTAVSQSVSRFTHPFDVARHPTLEPEVKRAILASWASDASAVPDQPALRRPADIEQPVPVDDVLAALRALDHDLQQATRH